MISGFLSNDRILTKCAKGYDDPTLESTASLLVNSMISTSALGGKTSPSPERIPAFPSLYPAMKSAGMDDTFLFLNIYQICIYLRFHMHNIHFSIGENT